jgi:hypothetical protein
MRYPAHQLTPPSPGLRRSAIPTCPLIENTLHYVKDVTMKEDASKTRTGNAPQNISLIKNLALNLLRQSGYTNIAQAIRLIANDIPKIWGMVSA